MRKLVLMMAVSLDGLVARPGKFGAGGWGVPPEDSALKARKLDWLGDAGLHLMGRATPATGGSDPSSRPHQLALPP